jgi:plastocyanin
MNRNAIIAVVVILIIIIIGYLVYANSTPVEEVLNETGNTLNNVVDDMPDTTATSTATTSPATSTPAATTGSVKSFTVEGSSYSFTPSTITVNKGDTVKITFVNKNGIHDLVVDGYNVRTKQIGAGKQETIQFVANKTGTFEYYCSVGNHRAMGMKGSLKVQ